MRPLIVLLLLGVPAAATAGTGDLLAPVVASQVKTSAAGGGRVVTFEAQGEPEALWGRLRAAREAEGWRLVRRYPTPPGRVSATLVRHGQRLVVKLSRGMTATSGLLQTVTPPSRLPRLRGPCVAIPERRFEILVHPTAGAEADNHLGGGGHAPQSTRWGFRTRFDHDLDGDGLLDALVPLTHKAYCPQSVRQEIYITRCAAGRCCGQRVGSIGGGRIDAGRLRRARPGRAGLKPITITVERTEGKGPIPERYTYALRYAFDGRSYRVVHKRRRGGRCHHCSFPTCTGPINVRDCPLALPERPSDAVIRAGMERAHGLARRCYKQPLQTATGRAVSVNVELAGKSGKVAKVEFSKHGRVPVRLQRCIRQALRQVSFGRFCAPRASFAGPLAAPRCRKPDATGCTPGSSAAATPARDRAVLAALEAYRKAMVARDTRALVALVHPRYADDAGTPDPGDDLDRAAVVRALRGRLGRISAIRYRIEQPSVTWETPDRARIDATVEGCYRLKGGKRICHTDRNRFVLQHHHGRWLFVRGM